LDGLIPSYDLLQYTTIDENYENVIGGNEKNGDKLAVTKCKYNNYY